MKEELTNQNVLDTMFDENETGNIVSQIVEVDGEIKKVIRNVDESRVRDVITSLSFIEKCDLFENVETINKSIKGNTVLFDNGDDLSFKIDFDFTLENSDPVIMLEGWFGQVDPDRVLSLYFDVDQFGDDVRVILGYKGSITFKHKTKMNLHSSPRTFRKKLGSKVSKFYKNRYGLTLQLVLGILLKEIRIQSGGGY